MKKIINKAYQVFANYKAILPLDICTVCCMNPSEANLLASLNVNEIPLELLMEYNDGASTAKTPPDEIKYFLPRYMELVSQFKFPTHSAELSFRRLEPFTSDDWSAKEIDFLEEFAVAFFKNCLSFYPLPEQESIDAMLVMIGKGNFPIEPILTEWEKSIIPQSILHYRDLLESLKYNRPYLYNPFADEIVAKTIFDWANDIDVKSKFKKEIEKIIMNVSIGDELWLEEISWFYDEIE